MTAPKITKTIWAEGKWGRNFTIGRGGKKPGYINIHYTATMASALNNLIYFSSRYVGASAHFFIDVTGELFQSVRLKDIAWSVGASSYKHKTARNSNSINIEVVARNNKFTAAQEEALNELVVHLMEKYNIPKANVLRHYDVTGKKCPAWYVSPQIRWTALRNKIGTFVKPKPKPVSKPLIPSVPYFKKVTLETDSIVAALKSIKSPTSFKYRTRIATANGIKGYKGTTAQNTKLLSLAKAGKLKRP